MDSKLDSIFRTTFMPAEKSDAWMGIRRHDPDAGQGHKKHREDADEGSFGEDHTTLSVAALQGFLQSLLQQAGEAPPPATTAAVNPELDSPATPAQSGYRAATQAYQAGAQRSSTAAPQPIPAAGPGDGPALALGAEERRVIHKMQDDLTVLTQRGIGTITLQPAARFLDSLAAGVADALAASAAGQ